MQRFEQQTALISGGLGAMGIGIARRLMAEGARVVLGDLPQGAPERLAAAFPDAAGRPAFVSLDVTQASQWEAAVAETIRLHGRIDVLVNNAGVVSTQSVPFDQIDLAEWQRLFAINVDGTFLGVQAGLRAMKAQSGGGAIVNLGSIAGYVGSKEGGAYGSSKSAVRNLTKQAAVSAARMGYNVRVNAVHPGYVWTPLIEQKLIQQFGGKEAAMEAVRGMNPMHHIVGVDDVAAAVAFLASADARMITGADLVIDGGRLIQ
ncbi:MAG: SDR family oxidoreductase [Variovorax sp.]|nr:SDR family oxidoreductase [Variovorax sp.]